MESFECFHVTCCNLPLAGYPPSMVSPTHLISQYEAEPQKTNISTQPRKITSLSLARIFWRWLVRRICELLTGGELRFAPRLRRPTSVNPGKTRVRSTTFRATCTNVRVHSDAVLRCGSGSMSETVQKRAGRFVDKRRNAKTFVETQLDGEYVDVDFHIFPGVTSRNIMGEVQPSHFEQHRRTGRTLHTTKLLWRNLVLVHGACCQRNCLNHALRDACSVL